jgi:shikimate kinase
VVSLGGGAVMTPAIAEALREVTVVWLSVSVTQASRRVGLNQARPLLLGNMRATLIKLLAERTPVYQNLATITVDADRTGVRAIVDQIISELKEVDE